MRRSLGLLQGSAGKLNSTEPLRSRKTYILRKEGATLPHELLSWKDVLSMAIYTEDTAPKPFLLG